MNASSSESNAARCTVKFFELKRTKKVSFSFTVLARVIAVAAMLPHIAGAAVISFSKSRKGGNRYLTKYTVTGQASDPTISEFTIYFDPATTRNLAVSRLPAGWDSILQFDIHSKFKETAAPAVWNAVLSTS